MFQELAKLLKITLLLLLKTVVLACAAILGIPCYLLGVTMLPILKLSKLVDSMLSVVIQPRTSDPSPRQKESQSK